MQRYVFVVGVSLAALEAELNRIVEDDRSLSLKQVFFAQGTGFVGVVEHLGRDAIESNDESREGKDEPAESKREGRRSRKKLS